MLEGKLSSLYFIRFVGANQHLGNYKTIKRSLQKCSLIFSFDSLGIDGGVFPKQRENVGKLFSD